jgi:hypothetical protein
MSQMTNDGGGSGLAQAQHAVQERAREARSTAGSALATRVDDGSQQVGGQFLEVAQAFRRTTHGLRAEGKERPAATVDAVTGRIEQVGRYLTETSSQRKLHDFEHFGRRNPWLVIAGGAALGFAASRFLKASSGRRFDTMVEQGYSSRQVEWVPPAPYGRPVGQPGAPMVPPEVAPGGVR